MPELTPEEREAAARLHVDQNPFGAAHDLLTTPLDEDPASRVNEKTPPARRNEPHDAAWIREFTKLITLVPESEYAAAEAKVAALFADGLPMTASRYLACERLGKERRAGLVVTEELAVRGAELPGTAAAPGSAQARKTWVERRFSAAMRL